MSHRDAILRSESGVIILTNLFLIGFALDGAISLLDELLGASPQSLCE